MLLNIKKDVSPLKMEPKIASAFLFILFLSSFIEIYLTYNTV